MGVLFTKKTLFKLTPFGKGNINNNTDDEAMSGVKIPTGDHPWSLVGLGLRAYSNIYHFDNLL